MRQFGKGIIFLAVLIIFFSSSLFAQEGTATLTGRVTDPGGLVVAGAKLEAVNVDTNVSYPSETNGDGFYTIPNIPPGKYRITVDKEGFQRVVKPDIDLHVADILAINFTLQVGSVAQSITVEGGAPLVNTTTSSLGSLVDEQKVEDLPLNGRNYTDLVLLQPGTTHLSNTPVNIVSYTGDVFSSSGAPVRSNNFLLDGAMMTSLIGVSAASATGSTLGLDGIREFRVITNALSAEYGMRMGSQTLIVSQSGTNNFHGSVFEYLRNSALDAANYFDRPVAANGFRRLPAFRQNDFGGSVGGPIRKDRTFFFAVFEGLRSSKGLTTLSNVMPSACHTSNNVVTSACSSAITGTLTVAPVIQPLLALFPNPNLPNNQYTFPFTEPINENYGQMRIDHNFSAADTLFVRYTGDDNQEQLPFDFPQFPVSNHSRAQYVTVGANHVFTPALLNTERFSYSRIYIQTNPLSPLNPTGPQYSFLPGAAIGDIAVGGESTIGTNSLGPSYYDQNIFAFSDDAFFTRGRHSLKFGTLINYFEQPMKNNLNGRGNVSFANLLTFLQGQTNQYQAPSPGSIVSRRYRFYTVGFYAEDDFRVRSNLTLNLGLRYEFTTTTQELNGLGAALRNVQTDAAGTLGPPFKNPSLKNLGPRIGFAWDVKGDGKTAVRAGFGLLYDIGLFGGSLLNGAAGTPPFSTLDNVSNSAGVAFTVPLVFPPTPLGEALRTMDYNLHQPHILEYNLAVERQLPWSMALTLAYVGSRGLKLMQYEEGNPNVAQILPGGVQFWPANAPRTNPNWHSTIGFLTSGGDSYYNAFEFSANKRLSHGLSFQSSYTWSNNIDDNQAQGGNEGNGDLGLGSDPTRTIVDRGLTDFDITNDWTFNAIYEFPEINSANSLATKALNGWRIDAILSMASGMPFTPALNTNRSNSGVGGGISGVDRPNRNLNRSGESIVSGVSSGCGSIPAGTPLRTPLHFYDPCAFSLQPAGFLGTAGRNMLIGPNLRDLDFSLVKDTALRFLGESGNLEFRAELFNILNRPNFSLPNRIVFAGIANGEAPLSTAGQITSTVSSSRQIQLALRLAF